MSNELTKVKYSRRHTFQLFAAGVTVFHTRSIWASWGGKGRSKKDAEKFYRNSEPYKGIDPINSPILGGLENEVEKRVIRAKVKKKSGTPIKKVIIDLWQAGPETNSNKAEAIIHTFSMSNKKGEINFETFTPGELSVDGVHRFRGFLIRAFKSGYNTKYFRVHLDSASSAKGLPPIVADAKHVHDIVADVSNDGTISFEFDLRSVFSLE